MSSKRWWRSIPIGVTAIVAVTFGAGLGGSAAMGADVDGVDANGEPTGDVMVGQDLVMEVVDPLLALVNPTEGGERVTADGAEYGYAGVIVDPVAREVDVYWVGSVEAKAQRILDRAPSEVTLNVRDAKYTVFEMQEAVERLPGMTVDDASGDLTIVASGPEADGSGVWVEYSGDGVQKFSSQSEDRKAVSAAADREIDVDITSVDVGEELTPAARWNGDAPYEGGGGYYLPNGGFCSTSFPVTSNATGAKHLLTAYHCVDDYSSVSVSNDAGSFGTAYTGSGYRHPDIDAALIKVTPQSILPRIYYGSYNTSSYHSIGAVGGNVVGARACTNGANSGLHCLTINRANYTAYSSDLGRDLHGLVRGEATSGGVVVVGGDSGGPVVYPQASLGGQLRAMGTIYGGGNSGTCPATRYSTSKCFRYAVWVGSVTISSEMGMTIATK
ncbi:hypothetical protein [Microbacterium halotolerans]|uniref:hypothetical protein n=1 Tax=Microbacterium halotolerans TaxID=246613 RepID=UPI000E6A9F8D|nr:hypothetical protein [Microbacterium halotolerans]